MRPVVCKRYFKAVIKHIKLAVVIGQVRVVMHVYVIYFLVLKAVIKRIALYKILSTHYKVKGWVKRQEILNIKNTQAALKVFGVGYR